MEVLRAEEHGLIDLAIDGSTRIRRDVVKRGWVQIRHRAAIASDHSTSEIQIALFAGSMVGLLPISEGIAVLVQPRFPLSLTHMANAVGLCAPILNILRRYGDSDRPASSEWMLDHIVGDFLNAAESVVHQGLMREYVERRTSTSSPKGRLLIAPTLGRFASRGIDYIVEIAYHERTEETAQNLALVEALHWCLHWLDGRRDLSLQKQRTVALLHYFRHVGRDRLRSFMDHRGVRDSGKLPASRSAYALALPLALAILERRGFSLDSSDGPLALSSLLVKTDEVFEAFVRLRLTEFLPNPGLAVLNGNDLRPQRLLFAAPDPADIPSGAVQLPRDISTIKPDILIEDGSNTRLVVDVKYKGVRGHADREEVIEQLVTYAHRLDCSRAVSVHPAAEGQEPGLFVSGRVGRTTIYNYRVNLGAQDLEAEMRAMAAALGALC